MYQLIIKITTCYSYYDSSGLVYSVGHIWSLKYLLETICGTLMLIHIKLVVLKWFCLLVSKVHNLIVML